MKLTPPRPALCSYEPTAEIKTAHIAWAHKQAAQEDVKVEVWDVVDVALDDDEIARTRLDLDDDAPAGPAEPGATGADKKQKGGGGWMRTKHQEGSTVLGKLDARTINVYVSSLPRSRRRRGVDHPLRLRGVCRYADAIKLRRLPTMRRRDYAGEPPPRGGFGPIGCLEARNGVV